VAVSEPAPTAAPVISQADAAAAREALRKKMQELDPGSAPITAPAPVTHPTPSTPVVTAPSEIPPTAPTVSTPTQPAIPRDVLRKKMEELEAAAPVEPTRPVEASRPDDREAEARAKAERKAQAEAEKRRREDERRATARTATPTPSAPQTPAVESRFPKSKAQRLAELLEKYRRDEITPAQYHAERARILADPAPTAGK
jgi:hypothetical protein